MMISRFISNLIPLGIISNIYNTLSHLIITDWDVFYDSGGFVFRTLYICLYWLFFVSVFVQEVTVMMRKGWSRSGSRWWTRRTLWSADKTTLNCCKQTGKVLQRKRPIWFKCSRWFVHLQTTRAGSGAEIWASHQRTTGDDGCRRSVSQGCFMAAMFSCFLFYTCFM